MTQERILQQLKNAWKIERDMMLHAKTARLRDMYSHGANAFVNAISVVLSDGTMAWGYYQGENWLKEQGEEAPYQ